MMWLKNISAAAGRLALHIENFGFSQGLKFSFSKQSAKKSLVSFHPKNLRHPFWLRTGSSDFVVYRDIFFNKQYDVSLTQQPDIIIDAGANIGLATLFFANKYPQARIIAIEPEKENFNILQQNVSAYSNVVCLNKAVWHLHTKLNIQSSDEGSWAFSVGGNEQTMNGEIETITFADILEIAGNKNIGLVKVDIEGAEKEVFLNFSAEWMDKIGTLIVETHDRVKPGCTKAVFDSLVNTNYGVEISSDNFIITIHKANG